MEFLKNTDFSPSAQPFQAEPLRMCLWNQLIDYVDTHLGRFHSYIITNGDHPFYIYIGIKYDKFL